MDEDEFVFPAGELKLGPEIARGSYGVVYKAKLHGELVCAKVRRGAATCVVQSPIHCISTSCHGVPLQSLHALRKPEKHGLSRGTPEFDHVIEELFQEAWLLASLRHDNIVLLRGVTMHPEHGHVSGSSPSSRTAAHSRSGCPSEAA